MILHFAPRLKIMEPHDFPITAQRNFSHPGCGCCGGGGCGGGGGSPAAAPAVVRGVVPARGVIRGSPPWRRGFQRGLLRRLRRRLRRGVPPRPRGFPRVLRSRGFRRRTWRQTWRRLRPPAVIVRLYGACRRLTWRRLRLRPRLRRGFRSVLRRALRRALRRERLVTPKPHRPVVAGEALPLVMHPPPANPSRELHVRYGTRISNGVCASVSRNGYG